jgi:RNA polymerase sigma-70 factor (ECF subfamily)
VRSEIQNAIQLLRNGRPESADAALAILQNTIFSFSMKVCGHREDAEDTMQETLLRASRQLRNFDSPEALAVWLYKVARSRCLMSRRRSKFAPQQHLSLEEVLPDRNQLEALTSKDGEGSPEQQLLRAENREELQQAVLRIPPLYRMVLVLHDMEELTPGEIARITGLRPGTVRVRLHRARAFLRNELAARPARRRPSHAPSRRCRRMFAVLSDYLDHELDPAMCAELEAHLDSCKPCIGYLASLEETVRRLKRHRARPVSPYIAAQIRKKLLRAFAGITSQTFLP